MLSNPQQYIFYSVLVFLLFWTVPPVYVKGRAWLLVTASFSYILSLAPQIAILIALLTILIWILSVLNDKWSILVSYRIGFLLFMTFTFLYIRHKWGADSIYSTIGLAFSFLRGFSLLNLALNKKKQLNLTDNLLYMLFFPTYSVGPITASKTLSIHNLILNSEFDLRKIISGFVRISLGFFKIIFLTSVLGSWIEPFRGIVNSDIIINQNLQVLGYCLLNFCNIYLNFSGISDVAIGSGLLFGIKIQENFNAPFLAKNMLEFWQRWHMSLGQWIKNELYMPLIRNYGRVYSAIFFAFITIGIWHDFTVNYFIWGAGHGGALALTQYYLRNRKNTSLLTKFLSSDSLISRGSKSILNIILCLCTLLYVSILSCFANCPSYESGLNLIKNIFTIYV